MMRDNRVVRDIWTFIKLVMGQSGPLVPLTLTGWVLAMLGRTVGAIDANELTLISFACVAMLVINYILARNNPWN